MTIDEKREALNNFCDEQRGCRFCPLSSEYEECSFDNFNIISAESVERAYNLAYGDKKEEINHHDRCFNE